MTRSRGSRDDTRERREFFKNRFGSLRSGGSRTWRVFLDSLLPTPYSLVLLGLTFVVAQPVLCLPPPDDMPEEVLRTEIITEARSPIDGKPLTAAEYAQLQADLADRSTPPQLRPDIREIIFLLRLRQLLQTITP